eukprot:403344489
MTGTTLLQKSLLQNSIMQNKSRIGIHNRNRSDNSFLQEGVKFPKAMRFQDRSDLSPGPQHYEPALPQDKVKGVVKLQNDGKFTIPSHVINNPLNYVKPLIVNLYYKKGVPDVGTYNPTHLDDITSRLKDNYKFSYKSAFDSKINREKGGFLIEGDKNLLLDKNRNDFYEIQESMKAKDKVKLLMPTPAFQQPVKPLLIKDLPPQLKELVDKSKQDKLDQKEHFDNPHYYGSLDDKLQRNLVRQTFLSADQLNQDRFGNQIHLKKPIEELPGPGYYHDNLNLEQIKPMHQKYPLIQPESKTLPKVRKIEKSPAPNTYKQEIEPKQVSFHFWGKSDELQPWIQ